MEKKRVGPKPVAPVSHNGIRYEVNHWGKSRGLEQNGGYVTAVDEDSGEELWTKKIYEVDYGGDMEDDKKDVFITQLKLSRWRNRLTVKNERGRRFAVDLADQRVQEL